MGIATIDIERIKADKTVKKEVLEVYTYLKIIIFVNLLEKQESLYIYWSMLL